MGVRKRRQQPLSGLYRPTEPFFNHPIDDDAQPKKRKVSRRVVWGGRLRGVTRLGERARALPYRSALDAHDSDAVPLEERGEPFVLAGRASPRRSDEANQSRQAGHTFDANLGRDGLEVLDEPVRPRGDVLGGRSKEPWIVRAQHVEAARLEHDDAAVDVCQHPQVAGGELEEAIELARFEEPSPATGDTDEIAARPRRLDHAYRVTTELRGELIDQAGRHDRNRTLGSTDRSPTLGEPLGERPIRHSRKWPRMRQAEDQRHRAPGSTTDTSPKQRIYQSPKTA